MSTFTASLQAYFTTFLTGQRATSQHTIAAYRDTFRMLLVHMHETTGTTPDAVEFTDLNAEAITTFLHYLEPSGTTVSGLEMPDWPPFIRSSPMRPTITPNTLT
jgi:site-specific recombinase XerD